MKIGFLFAGQGSQYVGMGKDLYDTYEEARQLIDHIHLDIDLKKVMFEGPLEKLTLNRYNQPAIIAAEMMIFMQHIALDCHLVNMVHWQALASLKQRGLSRLFISVLERWKKHRKVWIQLWLLC